MADRFARPALVGLATLALLGVAMPAPARTHHVATKAAASSHHSRTKREPAGKHGVQAKTPKEHRSVGPAGVTSVPEGGLKVFCPHHSPLLIRKATQGAGTTVTIVCR